MRKALGSWYTPCQLDQARREINTKLENEKLDETEKEMKRVSYYNRPMTSVFNCPYDLRFNFEDCSTFRRQKIEAIRDNIFNQERARNVPIATSQNYGHRRTDMEGKAVAYHKRQQTLNTMFCRSLNLKPNKKLLTNPREMSL